MNKQTVFVIRKTIPGSPHSEYAAMGVCYLERTLSDSTFETWSTSPRNALRFTTGAEAEEVSATLYTHDYETISIDRV